MLLDPHHDGLLLLVHNQLISLHLPQDIKEKLFKSEKNKRVQKEQLLSKLQKNQFVDIKFVEE